MSAQLGVVNGVVLMLPDGSMTVGIEPHTRRIDRSSKDYILPDGTTAKVVDWLSDEKHQGNGLLAAVQRLWIDGPGGTPLDALGAICRKVYWTGRNEQILENNAKITELVQKHAAEKAELERQLEEAREARGNTARDAWARIDKLNAQLAAEKRLLRQQQRKNRRICLVMKEQQKLLEQVHKLNVVMGKRMELLEAEEKPPAAVEPSTPPAFDDKK